MHSFGLKSHIIGTLIFLLTLGIIFSDIVIIMFWQRGLVEAEVRHVRTYLSLWSSMTSGKNIQDQQMRPADPNTLCKAAGAGCVGAAFFDGHDMTFTSKVLNDTELTHVVLLAALSRHDVIRFSGASWGIFTFTNSQLLMAVPVIGTADSAALGMVVELQPVYQIIKGKQEIVFWYMLVNVLFLTIIGFFRLHHVIVRPIERLVKISETYSGPEGQVFFSESRGGEFGQLSMALNSLLFRIEEDRKKLRATVDSLEIANKELIKTRNEMIRTEKFAAIGRLSTGLAHEVGNPIGIVQGYLELLQQADISSEERTQFSSRAISELERISRLIRQLLDFSRTSTGRPEPVNVKALLDSLIEMISTQQNMSSISFVKRYDMISQEVIADADGLRQVFLNCLLNAVDAVKEKGIEGKAEITVTCSQCEDRDHAAAIRIVIADNGIGITKDNLEKIFDPFFTTKEPGKGTGLGLSVSYSIIEAAGGRIWVVSEYEKGTSITIELPVKT